MKKIINNAQLEKHINGLYEKARPILEKDSIYEPLGVIFNDTKPFNFYTSYCFVKQDGYHEVFYDTRKAYETVVKDLDEFTYRILATKISNLVIKYMSQHSFEEQDRCRVFFEKELEIFGAIGRKFVKRKKEEIKKTGYPLD